MTKSNISFLAFFLLCFHATPHFCEAQHKSSPNIILILADDLGWSHLSCTMQKGNPASASDFHETPNLEKLARNGMRFTRGYASASICSPSRRSILFGQTPMRLGDDSFSENYDPRESDHLTIPLALKAIDDRYSTAHFGKWDMRAGFFPEDAGYDESDGNTGNRHGDVMTDKNDKWTKHFILDDPKRAFTLAERASNFMERQVRSGNPFYVQVSHYATHVDVQARRRTYDKYTAKRGGKKHNKPGFAAMLEDLDASIGQILDMVTRLGVADNTYVFFMADNGATEFFPPVANRLDHPDAFDRPMRNFPLRGGKWTLYEGGIRVPFIVKGPGILADSQCDVSVAGWDLLPTFFDLAGGGGEWPPEKSIDGGSFANLLHDDGRGEVARLTRDLIFHRYHNGYPHSALIDGNFKVIKFWKSGKLELYNLKDDPGEEADLAPHNPEKAEALEHRLQSYMEEVNPDLRRLLTK